MLKISSEVPPKGARLFNAGGDCAQIIFILAQNDGSVQSFNYYIRSIATAGAMTNILRAQYFLVIEVRLSRLQLKKIFYSKAVVTTVTGYFFLLAILDSLYSVSNFL